MRVLYFASVRERIGRAEEEIAPPPGVATVGELIAWLAARDEASGAAFAQAPSIRAALDHAHVKHDAPLGTAREVAFFPPMTGG